MDKSLSCASKLNFFTVLSASSIILIAGADAFIEHNGIAGADVFVASAGFIAFIMVLISGFSLSHMIMKPLLKAINDLNMESAEAAAASSQIQAASRELAEATIEESASIQETAATLEETTSMIKQSSANTKEAADLSEQAMQFAERSYSEMKNMLDYMEKIKDSSNEIFKIVKVIDQIAFQTNILSINASVEAAKVGSAGNAFAVVAEEVRNLSQRTEEAAKKTEDIITNNMQLVSEGFTLANDVEDSLSQIDQESKKISALMGEISIASAEQAKGVEEIHKAIAQMEIAVHSNAHSADECASAATDLSMQSNCVKEIVDNLSILVNGIALEHDDSAKNNDYKLTPAKIYVR